MKKILVICSLIAIASCSKKEVDPNIESNIMLEEPVAKEGNSAAGKDEGLVLIEGSDCLTCHKMDTKLVGQSYQEVADKYTEGDLDMLADKIVNGGKGNWGEVPMSAHAGMSKENAKKMVAYILTLKK